jgi:uncharacterized alkaline shock family protein YloU
MKARSGRFGDLIMTLLLLAIGAGLIYGSQFNVAVGQQIAEALEKPLIATGLGAILILSVILRWVGGCRKSKETFIDFQSDEGSVGISTQAIQDFIERVGKEFAAVKSIESKLMKGKDGLDIAVGVRVLSGNKIPELSQVLQQRIRESVRESLGLEEIGKITIQVKEIIGAPDKPATPDADRVEE